MTATAQLTVPAGARPPAPPRAGRRRTRIGERTVPYLLLAPAVITMTGMLG